MRIEIIKVNGELKRLIDPSAHEFEILFSGNEEAYKKTDWEQKLVEQDRLTHLPVLTGRLLLEMIRGYFSHRSWQERETLFMSVNKTLMLLITTDKVSSQEFEAIINQLKQTATIPSQLINLIESDIRNAVNIKFRLT